MPALIQAGHGRVVSVAFGTYDYTASCDITAREQTTIIPPPISPVTRSRASLAGTGVQISDGAPRCCRLATPQPAPIRRVTEQQHAENRAAIHAAGRAHYDKVRRSIRQGFYQGWICNPAQLTGAYAAVYAFFLEQRRGIASGCTPLSSARPRPH